MPTFEASKYYNRDWDHWCGEDAAFTRDRVQCILLQEVRDELKKLNALLYCRNFQNIPKTLTDLATPVRRREKVRRAKARAEKVGR